MSREGVNALLPLRAEDRLAHHLRVERIDVADVRHRHKPGRLPGLPSHRAVRGPAHPVEVQERRRAFALHLHPDGFAVPAVNMPAQLASNRTGSGLADRLEARETLLIRRGPIGEYASAGAGPAMSVGALVSLLIVCRS